MAQEITLEQLNSLMESAANDPKGQYSPFGCFYVKSSDGTVAAIDNDSGDAWVEAFPELESALAWLSNKSLSVEQGGCHGQR